MTSGNLVAPNHGPLYSLGWLQCPGRSQPLMGKQSWAWGRRKRRNRETAVLFFPFGEDWSLAPKMPLLYSQGPLFLKGVPAFLVQGPCGGRPLCLAQRHGLRVLGPTSATAWNGLDPVTGCR